MSATSILVSDILQTISDKRGESTTNSNASRIRAVSRAEQDVAGRRFFRTHILPNQTMVGNGTTTYEIGSTTYPMRLKGLTEVYVNGTTDDKKYQIIDYNAFKNVVTNDIGSRVVYEYYDVVNDKWKMVFPVAFTASDTIYYSYYWQPPTRTTTTDHVITEAPMAVVYLALAEIAEGEGEDSVEFLQKAENYINQLIETEESPAINQYYSIQAAENYPKNRGIGSY